MTKAGHAVYDSPLHARNTLGLAFEQLETDSSDSDQPLSKAKQDRFQTLEINVASADLSCRQSVNYEPLQLALGTVPHTTTSPPPSLPEYLRGLLVVCLCMDPAISHKTTRGRRHKMTRGVERPTEKTVRPGRMGQAKGCTHPEKEKTRMGLVEQPHRTPQSRDPPPDRRGRYLPQPRQHHSPRRGGPR